MATDTRVKVRSPYIVEISGVAGDETKVELFLWNDPGSVPSNPNYILEKPIPSTAIGKASYDISPFVREFIEHDIYSEVVVQTAAPVGEYCYCNVKSYKNGVLQTGGGSYTEELICFDGYGYFTEGQNPQQPPVMLEEGTYLISDTLNPGGIFFTTIGTVGTWSVLYTGETTGGTVTFNFTNTVGYIPYTYAPLTTEPVTVEIKLGGITQYTYRFIPTCEPKYTTINCDFVNKHGVWQRLVFFKANQKNFERRDTKYNLMPDDTNYDTSVGRSQIFNVNGNDRITCNTGWVEESYDDVITQLMLAETIKLDNQPYNLITDSVKLQQGINDNNINYTLEFRFAADKLNYNV